MGDKYRTMLNLEIIKFDEKNDLIYIKGSIPGSKNTTVFLKRSVKTINRLTTIEKIENLEKRDQFQDKEQKRKVS